MATLMQQRRGTAAEWATANPILAEGEIGVELDTGIVKVGNGSDNWKTLKTPYILNVGGTMHAPLATDVPFAIQGNANQVADLFRIVDVNGVVLSGINAKGVFFQTGSQRVTTKGDILVGTAADTLTRLAVGSVGLVLTADPTSTTGMKWAAASKAADIQVFTASSTWTKPANARAHTVIAFGAGASGQGVLLNYDVGTSPGGSGGTRVVADLLPSALADSVSVTIGAPGIAVLVESTGSVVSNGPNPGGDTVFGPIVAPGGDRIPRDTRQSSGKQGNTTPPGADYNSSNQPLGPGGGGGASYGWGYNDGAGTSPMGTINTARSGSGMGGDGGAGRTANVAVVAQPGSVPGGGGGGALVPSGQNPNGLTRSAKAGNGARGELIVITIF